MTQASMDERGGNGHPAPADDLERIVASARRLGVEFDEVEALQWLTAVALTRDSQDVVVDVTAGVFGHKVTMLDFSDRDLAWFREVGDIVGLPDLDDVETALALSGSAAQSKVQTYPGDCDYFERVNIKAATARRSLRSTGRGDARQGHGRGRGRDLAARGGEVRHAGRRRRARRPRGHGRQPDQLESRGGGSGPDHRDDAGRRPLGRSRGRTRATIPAGASSTGWSPIRCGARCPGHPTCSTSPGRPPMAPSPRSTATSIRTSRRSTSRRTRCRCSPSWCTNCPATHSMATWMRWRARSASTSVGTIPTTARRPSGCTTSSA